MDRLKAFEMVSCNKSKTQVNQYILLRGMSFLWRGRLFYIEREKLVRMAVSTRHLQRTYSARETGVMRELEKHNLTRITNAPAEFLVQF